MRRPDARVDRRRARAARRRSTTPTADRIEIVAARRRPPVFSPGRRRRRARGGSASTIGRVLLFVGRIQPLKGARPRGALPRRARRSRRSTLVVVGGPSGPDGAGRARARSRARRRARRRRPGALRRRRSPTTGSPTSTAPPTCASSRRAPSRSGSSRSKPPRAARRSSRRRSAGCARSSTTVRTGFLVDGRDPVDYAAPVALAARRPDARARDGRERGRALAALLVEHRPRRGCAGSTATSSRATLVRCD